VALPTVAGPAPVETGCGCPSQYSTVDLGNRRLVAAEILEPRREAVGCVGDGACADRPRGKPQKAFVIRPVVDP